MKDLLKWVAILLSSCGLAFIIIAIVATASHQTTFAEDYRQDNKNICDVKVEAFKDSSLRYTQKYLVTDKEVDRLSSNRYIDSANKYTYIYNYLNQVK